MDPEKEAGIENAMCLAEKILEKYGAEPQDINRKNREKLGQRVTYLYKDSYYRVDKAEFDGQPFVIVSSISDPAYAGIGLMEDVAAISPDKPEEEFDRVIRQALEIGGEA